MASILIFEDDELFRASLIEALSNAGHEVRGAADGEKGLRMFRAQPAALVLTDIIMPGKEGIEAVRELRQANPTLGIIAMSGGAARNAPQYLAVAKSLGADRTLQKPFHPADLLKAVEEVLSLADTPRGRAFKKSTGDS